MSELSLEDYRAMVGQEIGVSRWFTMDQHRIDQFAAVTEDRAFFHVDPERAKSTPFGGTVAHGFLTLAMLGAMGFEVQPRLKKRLMAANYGFDRVRMMVPVPAGSRIRGRFILKEIIDRGPKEIISKSEVTIEVEGRDKPALIAEWLGFSRFA
jgi:acyl dehydratase